LNKALSQIRAALYLRVSTEEQRREGFSLAAQEDILKAYCESKGVDVFDIYDDGGYSGKDFNRPRMQQLLKDLKGDKFDVVVAVAVDRISRNNLDVLTFVDRELHPRGKKLLISTCDIDSSTETGKMFISLLGTFAEYERQLIVSRVKKGMEKRASDGLWNGGRMLGYDVIDKKLVVNQEEANLVQEIFELRASGKGYRSIAVRLNQHGNKTKLNTSYSINTIKTILENEKYIGNMTWGKMRDWNNKKRKGTSEPTRVDGVHEAIITIELWDKVQNIRRLNQETPINQSNYKGEFILSGLLRCPSCGAGTVMSKAKKRDGTGYHLYYMCQNYHAKGKTACSSNLVRKEIVEEQVLDLIKSILADESIVDRIMSKLMDEESISTAGSKKELNIQMTSMKKLLEKQKKLDADYYSEQLSTATYSRLSEPLENEINELQNVIKKIEFEISRASTTININKELVIEALTSFDTLFELATNEEKRALLRALIKEIHMEPDRKNIKSIVFWFAEDDNFSNTALLVGDERRTVSQVTASFFGECC
jgi:site-specific DNA recombinase